MDWKESVSKCESLSQLVVEIRRLLDSQGERGDAKENSRRTRASKKFVLVFDGVDKQKEAQPTLLPALARMGELVSDLITLKTANSLISYTRHLIRTGNILIRMSQVPTLTSIFIVTCPRPNFLHMTGVPHIHFPAYTKPEALQILTLDVPPIYITPLAFSPASSNPVDQDYTISAEEGKELWTRFTSVVWDSLAKHTSRDILSLRDVCMKLWPSFTQPIRDGNYFVKDFSRLIVSRRALFQDEQMLVPSIMSTKASSFLTTVAPSLSKPKRVPMSTFTHSVNQQSPSITSQLPHTTRILLVAAYLASYTPSRTDTLLFMKSNAKSLARKRKKARSTSLATPRPGTSRHRRIARKLLGPQAFVAERMLAIFWALIHNSDGGAQAAAAASADVPMAIATLASLRLIVKASLTADSLDGSTKWKVNIGWDVVRSVARTVGVEVEEYFWEE